MKVGDFSNTEIEGDDFEGVDASIDKKNLSFLFDIVSKQMYRRPIPSIVREITSNCFDSHIEAGIDDPVVIKLGTEEAGMFISFTDVGVGMSPDRMKKVYSKWFSSTKRDSNDQIGMFGLGSKSPLAYTDSFFLTTTYNNIQYNYCIHKGTKVPRIELLFEDENIARNQTEVKIYVKSVSDLVEFYQGCKSQLAYFDNVYFDVTYGSLTIENHYTILEYETFKYRLGQGTYSDELHVIIGKVPYPISWDELGEKRISLPFGLKFNIGDLQVTPERESIRYIDIPDGNGNLIPTKEVIKNKIKAFKEEIQKLYFDTTDAHFEDYREFQHYENQDRTYLVLDNTKIDITGYVTKIPAVFMPLKDFRGKLPKNPFFAYQTIFTYYANLKSREHIRQLEYKTLTEELCLFKSASGKYNKKKNAYLFEQAQNLVNNYSFQLISKSNEYNIRDILKITGIKIKSKSYDYSETSAVSQYKLFMGFVESELKRLTLNYDQVEIPQDWLNAYNIAHARTTTKEEHEIIVHNYGKYNISDGKEYIDPSILEKFTGFIIYGFEEHEELFKNYRYLFIDSKYGDKSEIHPKKCRLYKTAKRNEKYFVNLKHAVFIEDFMSNNKVFKKFATAAMIEEDSKALTMIGSIGHMKDNAIPFVKAMDEIFPPVADTIRDLQKECDDFGRLSYNGTSPNNHQVSKDFIQEFIKVAKDHDLYNKEMYEAHLKLERYVSGLDLINHIVIQPKILDLLVDFLVLKNKRVDPLWTNPSNYERELIKESIQKMYYSLSIFEDKYVYLGWYVTKSGSVQQNSYQSQPACTQGKSTLSETVAKGLHSTYKKNLVLLELLNKHHEHFQTEPN